MQMDGGLSPNWKNLIKDKKVILYNTGISNLLNGGEKHINKIKQVLKIFERQSEVILWWRPHPLELSTAEAMRPELARQYKEIRNNYEKAGWGVLDTSGDLHRAIAISDGYYGDWSSLIDLYKMTGKPIMISSDDVLDYSEEIPFSVWDFVVVEGNMWFISLYSNFLFKMNMVTFEIEEVIELPGARCYENWAISSIVHYNGNLIMVPGKGEYLLIYNLATEKLKSVKLGEYSIIPKYSKGYLYKNRLIILPWNHTKMLQIDFIDKDKISIKELMLKCKINVQSDQKDKYIYMIEKGTNILYKYNVELGKFHTISFNLSTDKWDEIINEGDKFFLFNLKQKRVGLWNETSGKLDIINLPNDYKIFNDEIGCTVVGKKGIYVYPRLANMVVYTDKNSLSVQELFLNDKDNYYTSAKKVKDKIYAYAFNKNCWHILDESTGNFLCKKIKIDKKMKEKVYQYTMFCSDLSDENRVFYRNEDKWYYSLLKYICNIIDLNRGFVNKFQDQNYGKRIHLLISNNAN